MASNRRKSSGSGKGASTVSVLLIGLIIGLAVAAGVAFYVTKAPMPFVDKVTREKPTVPLPESARNGPDPNSALYGPNGGAGTSSSGPINTAPTPASPGSKPDATPSMTDEIGALLVTLGAPEDAKSKAAPAPAPSASATAPASAAKSPAAVPGTGSAPNGGAANGSPTKAAKPASTQTTYYLQAGAFRSENEANAAKARILMLGLPVEVQKAQVNGATLHRVRVGPFKGIDEMNRSRSKLSEAKIESTVVRP